MSTDKPPDWVGTPEVQELLAKAIAAELRAWVPVLRRASAKEQAYAMERRADELDPS